MSLERRYRRLLLAYPAAWRREREEEIVAVLMAGAPPERTRPTAGEAADLLLRGMQARLERGAAAWRSDWGEGVRVAGVVLAVMLGAVALRILVPMLGLAISSPDASEAGARLTEVLYGSRLWWADAAAWTGWLLTAIVIACGWARLAGPLAVASASVQLGVLVTIIARGAWWGVTPDLGWVAVGAFAAATLARPGRVRQAIRTLGRPGLAVLLLVSGALLALEPLVWLVGGPWTVPPVMALSPLAMAVPLVVSAWLLLRRPAGRRAVPFLAAAFALFLCGRVLVGDLPVLAPANGLDQWGSTLYANLGLAGLGKVVFVGVVPLLVLATGLVAVQGLERRLRR